MSITLPSSNPMIKFQELKDLKGKGEYYNDRKPLMNVELNHIVPDELHLLLRVTDVLIEGLIRTVIAHDKQQHHSMNESSPPYWSGGLRNFGRNHATKSYQNHKHLQGAISACLCMPVVYY